MRADQNIDVAFGRIEKRLGLLAAGAEAADHVDADGEGGHALGEGVVVLLRQNGGRDEHGHLHAVHHRLERGAHGDLGLAETDIAAKQAIHRADLFHILLQFVGGGQLVGGFRVGKGRLELGLHGGVFRELVAALGLSFGLGLQQLGGQILYGLLRVRPCRCATFVRRACAVSVSVSPCLCNG